jgi:pyrimidine deaminase RibD-like protein
MTLAKLILAYYADRSLKNAQKIRAYTRKHPMVTCLHPQDADIIATAIHHANREG